MKSIPIIIAITLCLIYETAAEIQICPCQNGGYCSSYKPSPRCICPQNVIGQFCQISAHEISDQPLRSELSTNYTYFYFQPDEVNYYKMIFNICMTANPSNSYTIFFIQTQKNDGTLKTIPSLFETAKLVLGESACTSFGTHYISVKRRDDDNFRRIIVGMKVMQDEEAVKYLNVYLGQNKLTLNSLINPPPSSKEGEERVQQITLSMSYEVYIHTSYYSTFILLFTIFLLFLVLTTFLMYLRSKYALESIGMDSIHLDNLDWQRRQRFNPNHFYYRYRMRNIRRLNIYMPVTKYGIKDCELTPKRLMSKEEQSYDKKQMETCSICLMDFQQQAQIRTTPCHHRYHRDCIDSWCENNMNCPYCRTQLNFDQQITKAYYQFLRNELSR